MIDFKRLLKPDSDKDIVFAIENYNGKLVKLTSESNYKPTLENVAELEAMALKVLIKCSNCGHVHNIRTRCPRCGKITDAYVD